MEGEAVERIGAGSEHALSSPAASIVPTVGGSLPEIAASGARRSTRACPGALQVTMFGKGLLILTCQLLACISVIVLIGFILAPIVWIWAMIAANNDVRKWNADHGIVS
jgi:hypothetical protein